MVEKNNTLAHKLIAASLAVGALRPDKTNTDQNYPYISADKILSKAGDALAEAGVMVIPSIVSEQTNMVEYTNNYNKTLRRYDALVTFEMILTDGETEIRAPWVGRGNDYAVPDKAVYKAITSGHKYFLVKLLCIGIGNEDGEHENAPADIATYDAPRDESGSTSNGNGHSHEVDFAADVSSEETKFLAGWRGPMDAQKWAIDAKLCDNNIHAQNAWKQSVIAVGGYSDKTKPKVFLHFLRNRLAKTPVPA